MKNSSKDERYSHISRKEYTEILSREESGDLIMYIDTVSFKNFLSKIGTKDCIEIFEEDFSQERKIIRNFPLFEFLILLISIISSLSLFKWYSILVIIGTIIYWSVVKGKASYGRHEITKPIIFLVLVVIFLFSDYVEISNFGSYIWYLSIPMIYLISKSFYYITAKIVFKILHRNYLFFDFFYNQKSPYYGDLININFLWTKDNNQSSYEVKQQINKEELFEPKHNPPEDELKAKESQGSLWENGDSSISRKGMEEYLNDKQVKEFKAGVKKEINNIASKPFHYVFVHRNLRDIALFKTMEFMRVCGLIGMGKSDNVFYEIWLENGGDKKLLEKNTFKPEFFNKGKHKSIFALKMPKAQFPLEASWVALQPGINKAFFTLELTEYNGCALCAWIIGKNGKPEHLYIKDNLKNNLKSFINAIDEIKIE